MDKQLPNSTDVPDTAVSPNLFGDTMDSRSPEPAPAFSCDGGKPRLQRAERDQPEFRTVHLDDWVPEDHVARLVWDFVEQLDVSPLLAKVRATEHRAGQPHIDPRLLLAVWLLATIDGIGSGRQLDKRCKQDLAYLWLLGGVTVNYHTLSDFRVDHGEFLDKIFTDSLASLLAEGLVQLQRTAQDGMRVRGSAGSSSFRSRERLQIFQQQARDHVQALKKDLHKDAATASRRQQAARSRAARERADRLDRALQNLQEIEENKEAREKGSGSKARASTTDPEARKMKMPDGGFRPGYNVQFATDESGIIVGCDVTNQGSDAGLMKPMIQQISENTGQEPKEHLADGGFSTLEDITRVQSEHHTKVYTPVKDEDKKRKAGADPFAPRKGDSPVVAEWRQRMGTEQGRTIYQHRGETAEWVNARARQRGMYQFTVRSLVKVRLVVLWHVLAHNLIHAFALRARKAMKEE
jgi:transposase